MSIFPNFSKISIPNSHSHRAVLTTFTAHSRPSKISTTSSAGRNPVCCRHRPDVLREELNPAIQQGRLSDPNEARQLCAAQRPSHRLRKCSSCYLNPLSIPRTPLHHFPQAGTFGQDRRFQECRSGSSRQDFYPCSGSSMAPSPSILHARTRQQFVTPAVDMWITLPCAPSFPHIHRHYGVVEGTSLTLVIRGHFYFGLTVISGKALRLCSIEIMKSPRLKL